MIQKTLSNILVFVLSLFILVYFFNNNILSQTKEEKEKARKLIERGMDYMSQEDVVTALHCFNEAVDLDPDVTDYNYKLAMAYFGYGSILKAYDIVEELLDKKDCKDIYYELAGNCQNLLGYRSDAEKLYKAGLKKFPNSGCLYLELGISEFGNEKYEEALKYLEKGIEAEPNFPANYYWTSLALFNTDNELWCILYGEAFMNLEKNTKKSQFISKILYRAYRHCIFPMPDSTHGIYFSSKKKNDNFTFGSLFEQTIAITEVKLEDSLDVKEMSALRTDFIKKWYAAGFDKKYPNVIFDFHKELISKGYFECYNYWLLRKGEPVTFQDWLPTYRSKFYEFTNWFLDNSLTFENGHSLLRKNYLE